MDDALAIKNEQIWANENWNILGEFVSNFRVEKCLTIAEGTVVPYS